MGTTDDPDDEDRDDTNLPVPTDTEPERLSRLREAIRDLDGPMSISNAQVPKRARTISTDEHATDADPNPSPEDLGHEDGDTATAHITREDGEDVWKMWTDDEDSTIVCDEDTFVEDLRRFA